MSITFPAGPAAVPAAGPAVPGPHSRAVPGGFLVPKLGCGVPPTAPDTSCSVPAPEPDTTYCQLPGPLVPPGPR